MSSSLSRRRERAKEQGLELASPPPPPLQLASSALPQQPAAAATACVAGPRFEHLQLNVGSLRGGGTVWLYELTGQNVPLVQWRGQWMTEKSLVWYLQDALARRVLGNLAPDAKVRLFALERLYPALLHRHS